MAMYTLLRQNPNPSTADVEESLQGNLCRCTGYRPILEAYYSFCDKGAGCCKNSASGKCAGGDQDKESLTDFSDLSPYDPSQELIFPSELQAHRYDLEPLVIKHKNVNWFRPTSMAQLLHLKSSYPEAKIVQGYSEIGIEMKFRFSDYQTLIDPTGIDSLKTIRAKDFSLQIGSAVTLSELQQYLAEFIPTLPEEKTRVLRAIQAMLHWFGGKHIRNTATWAGNLMTASPIADLSPLFMAAGAHILVESAKDGERYIEIDEHFFPAYRKTVVTPEEVVVRIDVPFTRPSQYFFGYKQAQRRDDDIAIVNAGMYVQLEPSTKKIADIRLSFGGVGPTTLMALKTMQLLKGRLWDEDTLNTGLRSLLDDITLQPGAPASKTFWMGYAQFLPRAIELCDCPNGDHGCTQASLQDTSEIDVTQNEEPMASTQIFRDIPPGSGPVEDPVGRPMMHLSGEKHTTGEAMFCDDIQTAGALHMTFVLSQKAHALIKSIDFKPALALDGVVDVVTYRDVPEHGSNARGAHHDQFVFAVDEVQFCGEIIAGVVAIDAETARKAAQLVVVDYEELPTVITIDQAIEKDSYLGGHLRIQDGDPNASVLDCARMVEGEVRIGGQEHFYLEPHTCLVIPGEDDEMEITCSTQSPTDVQIHVCQTLGIPFNKVVSKVKRIGGGFGGKETAMLIVVLPAAVAAYKLRKPVRACLERFDDMTMMGTRHPFLGRYKLGMDKDGRFKTFEAKMFSNCGSSYDTSEPVMQRALTHCSSVYRFPNFTAIGRLCKTNWTSSTVFRGSGTPQAMFIMESCILDAAYTFGMEPEKLRELNMVEEGDATPYGAILEQCNARRCWNECMALSDFRRRREEINEWNSTNRWVKRGIAVVPTKFGIGFGLLHMNQAGALVHIYRDGTVLISHAGVEIGQGLHTKVVQIASRALGIPVTQITINHTSTDKVPNTVPTAASISSDLNGMAVQNACEILMERLRPIMAVNPKGTWKSWIEAAFYQRISLSATGFYKSEHKGMDFDTGKGEPNNYYVYGAACTDVEIDCLTGVHRVRRTDIVMDIGESMNPAVDIGQIEGAFIQGYGLFTMEELKVSSQGVVLTRGPGTYKIPSANDIPRQFNVKLLKGSSNKRAIFSSKAVGEPPLFLGSSAFFAIKDAIKSAREDYGLKGPFRLDSPASPERIRLACRDHLSDMVADPKPGTYIPWTVTL